MIEIREFDYLKASEETIRAMAFRCEREDHDWRPGAGLRWKDDGSGGVFPGLAVFMTCYWCGAERQR